VVLVEAPDALPAGPREISKRERCVHGHDGVIHRLLEITACLSCLGLFKLPTADMCDEQFYGFYECVIRRGGSLR
jgi:hypothetical protein